MHGPTRHGQTRIGSDPQASAAERLLAPDEPPAFEVANAEGRAPLLLVCDHASARIPRALHGLGLQPAALQLHIANDIGAAGLTRRLAARLDAPAVLAGYSRLVIDCNRQPGDPQSILAASDGIVIPGNQNLSAEAQEARADAFFWPYHHAIEHLFARLRRRGPEPLLFSVHSFTPTFAGEDRFWDAGILWNRDPRMAVPLIAMLRRIEALTIGDNQPYAGTDLAYTLNLHAGAAGLAHAAVEVRQDHCETPEQLDRWAEILGDALGQLIAMGNLHKIELF